MVFVCCERMVVCGCNGGVGGAWRIKKKRGEMIGEMGTSLRLEISPSLSCSIVFFFKGYSC